ncbi:MAG: ABC transporter permease [Candidatus Devosia euplotis]|nr:ABC transporter permease [Candidatus Devosia euplotis]
MGLFMLRRLFYTIPALIVVFLISFMVIAIPPGDFVTRTAELRAARGDIMLMAEQEAMRRAYGLDQPLLVQYGSWISDIVTRGDFGYSFSFNLPVKDVIWPRMGLTVILSLSSLFFIWVVAIQIGIYSAVRRYTIGDYLATFIGFLGLAIPNFLLALAVMYIVFSVFGVHVGGLFSPEFIEAPWSWDRVVDLLGHLWLPMIVLGAAGTASVIRVIRANLMDKLHKPYVMATRAKGKGEFALLMKYPARRALNPFVSGQNDIFVDIVMGLQTTGSLLLDALRNQDMYMAASFILMLSVLIVIGTFLSDLMLAWLDSRIRHQQG